ncbi:hypothetical protein CAPTEDRAFT_204378 [Capitella teleta]|uniref:G-protein coupled receptors family 1 profile domain-containing protein n=1 Tax=Capitella teleta TaxID=283909 RepID=R7U2I8_CAPTE|nr:hypothetical protein CAPTEDRAFT_204378 [Capitella teleta]|eukprot:ELT97856.1 hypothetical protein CAPTEDRAFT_204378 [Capitella teleta]
MFAEDFTLGVTVPDDHHDDHEESHEDDDHEDDHGHHHGHQEVLSDFSQWNTALCASLLILILTICLIFNTLNAVTLIRKKSSSSNSAIMLLSSCMSLISYAILLPLTLAGVAAPKTIITENYCYVQESLTLCVVLLGFFLPSLNSLNRMIVVNTGLRNWCKPRHLIGFILGFVTVVALSLLIPLFLVKEEGATIHEHGCHLWSARVDPSMWYRVYTILIGLAVCITTMILSYAQIYRKVVASTNSISNHTDQMVPTAYSVTVNPNSSERAAISSVSNRQMSAQKSPNTATKTHLPRVQARFHRHRQVAKIASIMIGIYVVIWIPWVVVSWLSVGSSDASVNHELRVTTMMIGYIPAAVDPVLNIFMSPILKTEMTKRLERWTKLLFDYR